MKNLKNKKLYLQVYEELRGYIVQNNLRPGDKLPTEMEMASALGVSRNVLREAIKTLEIIGVVSSKPGVGIVVNSFNSNFLSSVIFLNLIGDDVDLVSQSQQVRKVLELGFARESFDSMTDGQIDELEEILSTMKKADNHIDFYTLDANFHKVILRNIKNDVLIAFVDSAWSCDRYYRSKFIDDGNLRYDKHKRILDALKAHDFEAFEAALIYHFSYNFKESIGVREE
ncbi:MAG: FadR/GntR family transcriptional regulator [Sphaerochaeta sp.]|jgi:DNA-binding FadR family transcriptional regulator|uniref:FadR/GntR family transcriptional regulator n=1 Tax=Sphaerochaeta sp. TaxID=1972642 RepID=UPI003D150586